MVCRNPFPPRAPDKVQTDPRRTSDEPSTEATTAIRRDDVALDRPRHSWSTPPGRCKLAIMPSKTSEVMTSLLATADDAALLRSVSRASLEAAFVGALLEAGDVREVECDGDEG